MAFLEMFMKQERIMEDFFSRRLLDLAEQSDRTGRFTFTGFLTEAEYAEFCKIRSQMPNCGVSVSGGCENAERVMLRFGDAEQLGYEEPFPIVCICIAPVQAKFADALTHRDFLGALMHLGIERSEIGDILVQEKSAYVFCREPMADYICRNIDRIRHTSVQCSLSETLPESIGTKTEQISVQAASERIDGVIAKVYHISRGDCNVLFRSGKVFLDGALLENNSYMLKEGEKISVRGCGKFRYAGISGKTKKGNLILNIEKFV